MQASCLMLMHVFEEPGSARVEFKTDALNEPGACAGRASCRHVRGVFFPQAHDDLRRALARLGLVLDDRRRVATGAPAAFRAADWTAMGGVTSDGAARRLLESAPPWGDRAAFV